MDEYQVFTMINHLRNRENYEIQMDKWFENIAL